MFIPTISVHISLHITNTYRIRLTVHSVNSVGVNVTVNSCLSIWNPVFCFGFFFCLCVCVDKTQVFYYVVPGPLFCQQQTPGWRRVCACVCKWSDWSMSYLHWAMTHKSSSQLSVMLVTSGPQQNSLTVQNLQQQSAFFLETCWDFCSWATPRVFVIRPHTLDSLQLFSVKRCAGVICVWKMVFRVNVVQ